MNLCTKHDTCVLCGSRDLDLAFTLEDSPLAENYVKQVDLTEEKYPLELYLCSDCKHLQLLHAINQRHLFENYSYQSQSSPGLVNHFKHYALSMIEVFGIQDGDVVVDIGSNDGTLLKEFKKLRVYSVIGVEPSKSLCEEAERNGVLTYNDFFTSTVVVDIQKKYGFAKLITANNVFAHSRHLDRMVDAVYDLLSDDGIFVIEVSYLPLMIRNMVFDFIYHEHLCYHRLIPLQKFFNSHGMKIIKIQTNAMKGGTARFTVVKSKNERYSDSSVDEAIYLEGGMKLDCLQSYKEFYRKIAKTRQDVFDLFNQLHADGASVIGYGASATTTTLLHHFKIGQCLQYLVDDNPNRIGLYSPGYHLEVKPVSNIYTEEPDYIFITAWRFAKQIIEQHKDYKGTFIIPLPELQVLGN